MSEGTGLALHPTPARIGWCPQHPRLGSAPKELKPGARGWLGTGIAEDGAVNGEVVSNHVAAPSPHCAPSAAGTEATGATVYIRLEPHPPAFLISVQETTTPLKMTGVPSQGGSILCVHLRVNTHFHVHRTVTAFTQAAVISTHPI